MARRPPDTTSATPAAPAAPRIRTIALPTLRDAEQPDLVPDGALDAVRLVGTDPGPVSLRGLSLTDCQLTGVRLGEADLTGSRYRSVVMSDLDSVALRAPRSTWREVLMERSRAGAAELYDSELDNVTWRGCRLGFVNLRSARLTDVLLADCVVDELDLSDAEADRVALPGTSIGSLVLRGSRLAEVDLRGADLAGVDEVAGLRGATLSAGQLIGMTELFAAHHGIRVLD